MVYQRIANGKVITVSEGNQPYIYVGVDAGKPSPGVGDYAFCTDTGKTYTCYVTGYWVLTASPAQNKYFNHQGTVDNVMSLTLVDTGTGVTDAANHEMDLSGGTTLPASADYTGNIGINPYTELFTFNCILNNLVEGTTSKTYLRAGTFDPGTEFGAYFLWKLDGTWAAHCLDATGSQSTAISALSGGEILTVVGSKAKITFLIDGAIVATHSTKIPNVTCYPCVSIQTSAAPAAAKTASVDYISLEVMI